MIHELIDDSNPREVIYSHRPQGVTARDIGPGEARWLGTGCFRQACCWDVDILLETSFLTFEEILETPDTLEEV